MNLKNIIKTTFSIIVVGMASCLYSATASSRIKEKAKDIKQSIPGIGLISNEIDYEGLKISDFTFDTGKKYTIVHPGEKVSAKMNYSVDSNKLGKISLHHFFYGLDPHGPMGCLVHSTGIKDTKGHTNISFNAPNKKGVYNLCISHSDKVFASSTDRDNWEDEKGNFSKSKLIGIVIVE